MKAKEMNKDIRAAINKKRLRHYEVAAKCGVNCYTFSKWLQTEMPEEKKKRVLKAIEEVVI